MKPKETEVSPREFWIRPLDIPPKNGWKITGALVCGENPQDGEVLFREVTAPHSSNLDTQSTNEALEYCMKNKSKAIDSIAKLEEKLKLAVVALYEIEMGFGFPAAKARNALKAIGPLDGSSKSQGQVEALKADRDRANTLAQEVAGKLWGFIAEIGELKADRDDYKAGAAVEAREADRLREELAIAKQEHDSLVIEISDDRKMLTLLSTQLVQAKAVFNEPSFEAFLTERLGAYSDKGFVTDNFTTKDMVGIGRDCAKWQDSQAHLKEIQVSKFTHGQPSNDFPFGEYEEFIKKEFQDYNQSCAACAKWGWGEAQNEIQILREQLMQADKIGTCPNDR